MVYFRHKNSYTKVISFKINFMGKELANIYLQKINLLDNFLKDKCITVNIFLDHNLIFNIIREDFIKITLLGELFIIGMVI